MDDSKIVQSMKTLQRKKNEEKGQRDVILGWMTQKKTQ